MTRRRHTRALAAAVLIAAVAPAFAQEVKGASEELAAAIEGIRRAAMDERKAAIDAVLALSPDPEAVLGHLALPQPKFEMRTGWSVQTAVDEAGVGRPYHLYVSEKAATAEREAPLLVDMHGGVSRQAFIDEVQFTQFRGQWVDLADEYGWVLALPLGRFDCTWWSKEGSGHVRATVRDAHRHARIDPDRVLATGFSDGGSGSFYLAMAEPEPFAAFLPMNGHPVVASRASERQLYLENVRRMPLFVAMTQDDGLYPARNVLPHVQALFDLGCRVHLVSYPIGGHRPIYFDEQSDAFAGFIEGARRGALSETLDWYAADTQTGSVEWLRIDAIGEATSTLEVEETANVMTRPGNVTIGIGVDRNFEGLGVKVTAAPEDRAAYRLGIREGDVIRALDGQEVATLTDLQLILRAKSHGDAIRGKLLRGETVHAFEGMLDGFTPSPSYVRELPTARVRASRNGQAIRIESHFVQKLTVRLADGMVDLTQPVTVSVGPADAPVAGLQHTPGMKLLPILESFARTADRNRLWAAELEIDLVPSVETPDGE